MIKIGILGDIGAGKSFIAKKFGYPVFNADDIVTQIYKKNKSCNKKLKKALPQFVKSFPTNKIELGKAILANKKNLKKIIRIVHPIVRKEMNFFIKKNQKKKLIVLDIPLLVENKLYKKEDILIFVDSKRTDINLRLNKRINLNKKLLSSLRSIQKPLSEKKKLSNYIIKNDFKLLSIKKRIKIIKKQILGK